MPPTEQCNGRPPTSGESENSPADESTVSLFKKILTLRSSFRGDLHRPDTAGNGNTGRTGNIGGGGGSSSKTQQRRFEQREMQATIRMAIIIAFFCGMWLGFFTVYVLHSWCPVACYIPRELDAFFFWLGYANSSINPILYTIFNEEFRKAFQKILGCYRRNSSSGVGGFNAGFRSRIVFHSETRRTVV